MADNMTINNERDEILLNFLDECIAKCPQWGMCPIQFITAKGEVQRIINERDALADYFANENANGNLPSL